MEIGSDFDDEKFIPWFWLNEHNSLVEYPNSFSNKIELCYYYHLKNVDQNYCQIYPQGWNVNHFLSTYPFSQN